MARKKEEAAAPDALRVSGDVLFAARKKLGETQFEMAHRAGVTPRVISQLEGDTGPDILIRTLGKIARAYEVEPAKLLTREPPPKVRKPRY